MLREQDNLWKNNAEMDAWDDTCWELAWSLGSYPTGKSHFEAYWRTLAINTFFWGSAAPPEYGDSYKSWIALFIITQEINSIATAPNSAFPRSAQHCPRSDFP